MTKGYYTAQICLNGHMTHSSLEISPEYAEKFCSTCGARTIEACPTCSSSLRGAARGHITSSEPPLPSYCADCGTAFPWTTAKLAAAKQLVDEFDELVDAQRDQLKAAIDTLATAGPDAELAASRFKRLTSKVGKAAGSSLQKIVTDVVSESVKKMLLGG